MKQEKHVVHLQSRRGTGGCDGWAWRIAMLGDVWVDPEKRCLVRCYKSGRTIRTKRCQQIGCGKPVYFEDD